MTYSVIICMVCIILCLEFIIIVSFSVLSKILYFYGIYFLYFCAQWFLCG